jgi:SAM-dependent methyltransferase
MELSYPPHTRDTTMVSVDEPTKRFRLRLARYVAAGEAIRAHLDGRAGRARALDAGSGNGRLALHVDVERLRWVGLDISRRRLAEAGVTRRYRLVRGSLTALPFEAGAFDVVATMQVLEHFVPEDARAIALRLGELVKPGGLLLVSVPIFHPSVLRAKRRIDRALAVFGLGPVLGRGHKSHFSLASARALVPPGFRIVSVEGQRLGSLPFKLLECWRWWYLLQRRWGRRYPQWAIEVNIAAVRDDGCAGAP